MKFLQIAALATLMIASAFALKCNVGTATGTCPSSDLGSTFDTCFKCVKDGVAAANGCQASGLVACATLKSACEASKGTYSSCTTDNCNGCSPASAIQASAFLLVAAVAAMLF
jgi:hypothetical protein